VGCISCGLGRIGIGRCCVQPKGDATNYPTLWKAEHATFDLADRSLYLGPIRGLSALKGSVDRCGSATSASVSSRRQPGLSRNVPCLVGGSTRARAWQDALRPRMCSALAL